MERWIKMSKGEVHRLLKKWMEIPAGADLDSGEVFGDRIPRLPHEMRQT
jgi:hypothetical protein